MEPKQQYLSAAVDRVSLSKMGFIVFLKPLESQKVVPIFIGASEAHSISTILNEENVPRPLTHDLFKNVLEIMGAELLMVHITSVVADTYYATITLKIDDRVIEIDSRPSDALGLALRSKSPVYIHKDVVSDSAVDVDPTLTDNSNHNQLETYQSALKKAIDEERYEDAAKLKQQILKLQKHQ